MTIDCGIALNNTNDIERVPIMGIVSIHTSLPNLRVSSTPASCKEYRKVPDWPMGRVPVFQTKECNPRAPEATSNPNGRPCWLWWWPLQVNSAAYLINIWTVNVADKCGSVKCTKTCFLVTEYQTFGRLKSKVVITQPHMRYFKFLKSLHRFSLFVCVAVLINRVWCEIRCDHVSFQ